MKFLRSRNIFAAQSLCALLSAATTGWCADRAPSLSVQDMLVEHIGPGTPGRTVFLVLILSLLAWLSVAAKREWTKLQLDEEDAPQDATAEAPEAGSYELDAYDDLKPLATDVSKPPQESLSVASLEAELQDASDLLSDALSATATAVETPTAAELSPVAVETPSTVTEDSITTDVLLQNLVLTHADANFADLDVVPDDDTTEVLTPLAALEIDEETVFDHLESLCEPSVDADFGIFPESLSDLVDTPTLPTPQEADNRDQESSGVSSVLQLAAVDTVPSTSDALDLIALQNSRRSEDATEKTVVAIPFREYLSALHCTIADTIDATQPFMPGTATLEPCETIAVCEDLEEIMVPEETASDVSDLAEDLKNHLPLDNATDTAANAPAPPCEESTFITESPEQPTLADVSPATVFSALEELAAFDDLAALEPVGIADSSVGDATLTPIDGSVDVLVPEVNTSQSFVELEALEDAANEDTLDLAAAEDRVAEVVDECLVEVIDELAVDAVMDASVAAVMDGPTVDFAAEDLAAADVSAVERATEPAADAQKAFTETVLHPQNSASTDESFTENAAEPFLLQDFAVDDAVCALEEGDATVDFEVALRQQLLIADQQEKMEPASAQPSEGTPICSEASEPAVVKTAPADAEAELVLDVAPAVVAPVTLDDILQLYQNSENVTQSSAYTATRLQALLGRCCPANVLDATPSDFDKFLKVLDRIYAAELSNPPKFSKILQRKGSSASKVSSKYLTAEQKKIYRRTVFRIFEEARVVGVLQTNPANDFV